MKLYDGFEEAFFVERDNRFVMQLRKLDGSLIKAYIANPGRMEEFLVEGHPFFVTSGNIGKYVHRIVSTTYQDSFLLLDTIKVNAVVERMLVNDKIPEFMGPKKIRREFSPPMVNSKFDFLLEFDNRRPILLEIKSCSLCHKGVAMFPDAPTERGLRHMEHLESLAGNDYDCYTLYLLNHKKAVRFMPNQHTHLDYALRFNQCRKLQFVAYCLEMSDPITLNTSVFTSVPIDFQTSLTNSVDKGSYLLVLCNERDQKIQIGALGERSFKKGYYVYVGSAMQGLSKRIKRHLSNQKITRWHLDYICPAKLKVDKVFPVNRIDRLEEKLAQRMMQISSSSVPGFGSSDSTLDSHLFYFPQRPYRQRAFLDLLLDARMMIL